MSTYRDDDRARREAEAARSEKSRLIDRVRIATACDVPWAEMRGDERVRFCGPCQKNVYNLSAMTLTEAEDFLDASRDADICIQLFRRRSDGTVITADCPVGVEAQQRRAKLRLKMFGAVCAAAVLGRLADASSVPISLGSAELEYSPPCKLGAPKPNERAHEPAKAVYK